MIRNGITNRLNVQDTPTDRLFKSLAMLCMGKIGHRAADGTMHCCTISLANWVALVAMQRRRSNERQVWICRTQPCIANGRTAVGAGVSIVDVEAYCFSGDVKNARRVNKRDVYLILKYRILIRHFHMPNVHQPIGERLLLRQFRNHTSH